MNNLSHIQNVSRRDLIKGGAALTLAIYLPGAPAEAAAAKAAPVSAKPFEANAFVRIGGDGRVTVISKHLEMGQGTYTGLATLETTLAVVPLGYGDGVPPAASNTGPVLLGGAVRSVAGFAETSTMRASPRFDR